MKTFKNLFEYDGYYFSGNQFGEVVNGKIGVEQYYDIGMERDLTLVFLLSEKEDLYSKINQRQKVKRINIGNGSISRLRYSGFIEFNVLKEKQINIL